MAQAKFINPLSKTEDWSAGTVDDAVRKITHLIQPVSTHHLAIDLTGETKHNKVVLGCAGGRRWFCWCILCKLVYVTASIKANGCWRCRQLKSINVATTHGMSKTLVWSRWNGMKSRCYYKGHISYPRYGGAGVTVHPDWIHDFMAFYNYIGPMPSATHQIDRIDNSKGYEPGNVRWVLPKQQQRNRSNNFLIKIDGVTKTLFEWSEISGVGRSTIAFRIQHNGWPAKLAVFTEPRRAKLTIDGVSKTISEWAEESGNGQRTIRDRLYNGWKPKEAVFVPTPMSHAEEVRLKTRCPKHYSGPRGSGRN